MIAALCEPDIDHSGGSVLKEIDTALSDAPDRTEVTTAAAAGYASAAAILGEWRRRAESAGRLTINLVGAVVAVVVVLVLRRAT